MTASINSFPILNRGEWTKVVKAKRPDVARPLACESQRGRVISFVAFDDITYMRSPAPAPSVQQSVSRRCVLPLIAGALATSGMPPGAHSIENSLGYLDSAGQKSYSQVQRAWEQSADMTQRERMLSLRGASKPTDGQEESPKAKKRRAMAGCHDAEFRVQAGYKAEADCNARVMGGDVGFILDVMDASS